MVIVKESKKEPLTENKLMQTGVGVLLELLIKMEGGAVTLSAKNQHFRGCGNAMITGTRNAAKITPFKGNTLENNELIISGQYVAIYTNGKSSGRMIIDTVTWGVNKLVFHCGSSGDFTLTF